MDQNLLKIIVCPICNNKLYYNKKKEKLICEKDSLSFPLKDGIPILLETEASIITPEEKRL